MARIQAGQSHPNFLIAASLSSSVKLIPALKSDPIALAFIAKWTFGRAWVTQYFLLCWSRQRVLSLFWSLAAGVPAWLDSGRNKPTTVGIVSNVRNSFFMVKVLGWISKWTLSRPHSQAFAKLWLIIRAIVDLSQFTMPRFGGNVTAPGSPIAALAPEVIACGAAKLSDLDLMESSFHQYLGHM